jgi:hypothetical protein
MTNDLNNQLTVIINVNNYSTALLRGLGRFSSLLFTAGRTYRTGHQPVARPLPTQDNTNTQ